MVGNGEGAVFRLVVDTGGNVTLTQYQQIDHLPEDLDGFNDNTNLALANGASLLSATATTRLRQRPGHANGDGDRRPHQLR